MKRVEFVIALVCAIVLAFSGVCGATALLPNLPPASYSVAGESNLNRTTGGTGNTDVYVDWIVFGPGQWSSTGFEVNAGNTDLDSLLNYYLYVYQLENTSGENLDWFTVDVPKDSVVSAGWVNDGDLDTAHNSGNYANLVTEQEAASNGLRDVVFASIDNSGATPNVSWGFTLTGVNGLLPGYESETMWFISPIAPVYAYAGTKDGNEAFDSPDLVPAPSPAPEPSTMLLMGSGLSGLFTLGSLRKKKANQKKTAA